MGIYNLKKGRMFMKKRILALILSFCLIFSTLAVGVSAADGSTDLSEFTVFVFDGDSVTVKKGTDTNYEILVLDSLGEETEADSETDADGNTVYSVPDASDGQILVSVKKKGGNYVFEGNGNGCITVAKSAAETNLYLNGITLDADFTSAIAVGKSSASTVTISAVDSTVNTLSDSAYNNDDVYADNASAENAVLKFKADTDVVIAGSGVINIEANGKNAIKSNGLLTINDAVLNIDALDNGISSESELIINSGKITIETAEGDGIKACADDSAAGDITINGGDIEINAYADGIQATMNLTITGGTFDITTYGGYDAVYDGDDDSYPSAKGLKASGSYTVTADDGTESEVDATGCQLVISGGTFNLNCADDAIHSDGDAYITGGTYVISTGDDAIHSEYILTLGAENGNDSDLKVTIENSYEGIEGATISIYSGTYKIFSSDDCINAANADLTGYAFTMDIYGGNIYASTTEGDCFDSNGNLTIYGGTVVALAGINTSDNEALDSDGTMTIKGGSVFTVQSSSNSMTRYYSEQAYAAWTSAGTVTASTGSTSSSIGGSIGNRPGMGGGSSGSFISDKSVITITDSSSNVIFSVVVDWQGEWSNKKMSYAVYSSDALTSGAKYTIAVSSYVATASVTLSDEEIEFSGENTTYQLTAVVSPTNASDRTLVWASSDDSVVTVDDNGLVKCVGEGTAVITVTTVDGYSDTCQVTVSHECSSLQLEVVEGKDADCYNDGNITYYKCSCGKLYSDSEAKTEISLDDVIINASAHPQESLAYTEAKAATHTEDGNTEYWTCTLCGNNFADEACTEQVSDVVIPAAGHDDANTLDWTKEDENHSKVCSCGEVLASEAHDFNWIIDTASTCTAEGVQHEECEICGFVRNENTPVEKASHSPEKVEGTDATCTEDGNTDYWKCSVCEKIYADESCALEIAEEDVLIPNEGHDYVPVVTEPTTESYGYTTYTCSVCGDYYTSDYVDPIEPVKTVTVSGTVTSFISETDEVAITLRATSSDEILYQTVTVGTEGAYVLENVAAGEYILEVSKKNHVNREYEVTVSEDAVTMDLKICSVGDVNGDGKVNSIDVALANAHAKGVTVIEGYQLLCADVTGDSKVNSIDVARINAHAKGVSLLW